MNAAYPELTASRPARRGGPALVLVLLAFLVGLAVMAALVSRFGLFAPRPATPVQARPAVAAPVVVVPPQAPVTPDAALLEARLSALAAQLSTLEARTAAVTGDDNAFKPAMVRGATVRALTDLAARAARTPTRTAEEDAR